MARKISSNVNKMEKKKVFGPGHCNEQWSKSERIL